MSNHRAPSNTASWAHGVVEAGRRERREAACMFAVHGVKKNGQPYQDAMSVHETRDAAEAKADYYRSVNDASRRYVVVER